MVFTPTNITALYFNDSTTKQINGIRHEKLTQDDITNTTIPFNYTYANIIGITISTDVEKLEDYLFTDCSNLSNIVIYNTDILTYIGSHIFDDISSNGEYTFYSKKSSTTPPLTYYYTQNIDRLTNLIKAAKPNWRTSLKYTFSTDFGVLCNDVTQMNLTNTEYYDFAPIDISYSDFHSLFFLNNRYFHLTHPVNLSTKISTANLTRYTVINNQTTQNYLNNELSLTPIDFSFNLYSTVLNHYQYNIPYKSWSIESKMQLNKQLSKLNSIYDFQYNILCELNENNHCHNSCKVKNNTKLLLDELFNIYQAQGVVIATDNSFNNGPIRANGFPIDASLNKYMAVLTLYLRSSNSNVKDISLRFPYLINFAGSMPKSAEDKNYYRYNP
jgi:hypothetical protein